MYKSLSIKSIYFLLLAVMAGSCSDLDLEPYNEQTSLQVYGDFSNYKSVLAKIYGGLALSGQQGPSGRGDIGGQDEGASTYIRAFWKLQELPTDEAIIAWNDEGLPALNTMTWSADNGFIGAMYYRIFYQITLANEYIRELSDANLAARNITGNNLTEAVRFRSEARFLRALSYFHALDFYGNVPFVTEEDLVGSFFPDQIQRTALFDYIESELIDVLPNLVAPRQNEYGRVDQTAGHFLLAKLYLNAGVYAEQNRYTDAITHLNEVLDAGYTLEPVYDHLFFADNDASNEIIFPIAFDQTNSLSWGGATFLVNAAVGGSMDRSDFGIPGGWQGLRARPQLVDLYPSTTGSPDARGRFHTAGQEKDIETISQFTDGYAVYKYRNITQQGNRPAGPINDHVSVDFPLMRLGDAYLMYAEAVLRGGSGGSTQRALELVNELRMRAYGNASGNIAQAALTLDFILDERARELKWEGHRRTDLIRFGRFTDGSYLWQWKGGTFEGAAVPDFRNLYPIPAADLTANPTLNQNPGY